MGTVYPCPLCDRRVNRTGEPFEDPSQTQVHIDGAHDSIHAGESGADHRISIEENQEDVNPSDIREDEQSDADGKTSPPLPSVETDLTDRLDTGSTPLPDAVEMNATIAGGHIDRVNALEDRVASLHKENKQLRSTLRETRRVAASLVLTVAETHDANPSVVIDHPRRDGISWDEPLESDERPAFDS